MLLLNLQSNFSKSVDQSILIYFLQMPVSMIDVNVIGRLPDAVAQLFDVFHTLLFAHSIAMKPNCNPAEDPN